MASAENMTIYKAFFEECAEAREIEKKSSLKHGCAEKKPVRVVRCISRLNIGGPSIHASLLHHNLDSERFETFLITGMISPEEGNMEYLFSKSDRSIYFFYELRREINIVNDIKVFFKIFRFFFKIKPDILHTHLSKAGTVARLAGIFYNIFAKKKMILFHTFHGNIFHGYFGKFSTSLFRLLEMFLAKFTFRVIAISDTQKKDLCELYKIASDRKVKIVRLGFDLNPFLNCSRHKGSMRSRLSIHDSCILIGIIGRMVPIKNHHLFIKAAEMLSCRFQTKSIRFIVVGDGELRPELEASVEKSRLRDQVFFLGWIKDIPEILADLDILMLTSLNEGTPVSVIEAMAASVPVLSSDVGGVGDLLGKKQSSSDQLGFHICERGILCPTHDVNAFVHALEYMILSGYYKKKKLKDEMRDFVIQHYSQSRLVDDMENLYKEAGL